MSNIKDGLRTLLLSQPTITAIVGAEGVYVNKAPQGKNPPYAIIDGVRTDPLGTLTETVGLRFKDTDIDCFAATEPVAQQLANAVSDFLKDYVGPAGPDDTINAVLWTDEDDDFVPDVEGGDQGRHLVTLDFNIQYTPN